jgi:hypothetical protein
MRIGKAANRVRTSLAGAESGLELDFFSVFLGFVEFAVKAHSHRQTSH